jgi:hypothetical protein
LYPFLIPANSGVHYECDIGHGSNEGITQFMEEFGILAATDKLI